MKLWQVQARGKFEMSCSRVCDPTSGLPPFKQRCGATRVGFARFDGGVLQGPSSKTFKFSSGPTENTARQKAEPDSEQLPERS